MNAAKNPIVTALEDRIDELNTKIDEAERLIPAIEEMKSARANCIAARNALVHGVANTPAPAPVVAAPAARERIDVTDEQRSDVLGVIRGYGSEGAIAATVFAGIKELDKRIVTKAVAELVKAGTVLATGEHKAKRYHFAPLASM